MYSICYRWIYHCQWMIDLLKNTMYLYDLNYRRMVIIWYLGSKEERIYIPMHGWNQATWLISQVNSSSINMTSQGIGSMLINTSPKVVNYNWSWLINKQFYEVANIRMKNRQERNIQVKVHKCLRPIGHLDIYVGLKDPTEATYINKWRLFYSGGFLLFISSSFGQWAHL